MQRTISIHSLVKRETFLYRLHKCVQPDFNPLPRKEGDQIAYIVFVHFHISIHSLVKRETPVYRGQSCTGRISIHSLVKRETYDGEVYCSFSGDFNPLPRKEGDFHVPERTLLPAGISIHSLVKRETILAASALLSPIEYFNPLPRKEGDQAVCGDASRRC